MSNHKWVNNICAKCGTVRERKGFARWQRTASVLVNGVWEDKHYYTYGTSWYYGKEHGFDRPPCAITEFFKNKAIKQTP